MKSFFILCALFFLVHDSAMAYLDPGSGNLIIQSVVAIVAGAFIALRSYRYKIIDFFKKNKPHTTSCRVCEKKLESFISFGNQPIANGFLSPDQFSKEYFFELSVGFCNECKMAQLISQPDAKMMFHENYAFFSSTSKYMEQHFATVADKLSDKVLPKEDPFVLEIGSNDGIFLQNFKNKNIRHLGVEPSANVAKCAMEKGINTTTEFFDKELAAQIVSKNGTADLIFSANVICHIPNINSIYQGVKKLLSPKGYFVYEDPYLGDIIQKTSYDQIYDEHVFFFSALSVSNLAQRNGLELVDVEHIETHGGSMRYFIAHAGAQKVSQAVKKQIEFEKNIGLENLETYIKFSKNVENSKEKLFSLLKKLKLDGKRVVGYAATSKSTTVTNYCNITPDLVEFISDTTPLKQNKFSPGVHIPVKSPDQFKSQYPDYALLFGWNHAKEIMEKEQDFVSKGGKWIVYVPEVKVI
ncbi:MAG: class I SAM-dependent methyltransferase [Bdellovibrionota bacterium]